MINELIEIFEDNIHDYKVTNRVASIIHKRYGMGYYQVYCWVNEGGDPEYAYKGYDINKAKLALQTAGHVKGFEHMLNTWLLECVKSDNIEIIEYRDIVAINDNTDAILYEVQQHFGGKYSTHWIDEDNGDYLTLRVADHSGKHRNVNGRYISIVIANDNKTEHFYKSSSEGMRNEHYYNDEYSAEHIINDITRMLAEAGITK